MKEKEFIDMFTNNVCLLDPKVSLQAKGLYYSMLLNMYNEEHSFKEIIKSSRLDTDEVYLLLLDLIIYSMKNYIYFVLSQDLMLNLVVNYEYYRKGF